MKKLPNFLVTVVYLNEQVLPYIVRAESDTDALEIAKDLFKSTNDNPNNYSWDAIKLSTVKRLSRKDLSIKEVMAMISDPNQFRQAVEMFIGMVIKRQISIKSIKTILGPYAEFVEPKPVVERMPKPQSYIIFNWDNSTKIKNGSKIGRFVLQFIPPNKAPFKYEKQEYDFWFINSDNGEIILEHIDTKNRHNIIDFVIAMRKAIPDLPTRIETTIIQSL